MTKRGRKSLGVESSQVIFRVSKAMRDDLEEKAKALGLDVSGLLRMILAENLPLYSLERRRASNIAAR